MTNDDSFSLNDWFFSVVAKTDGYLGQHGFLRSGKTNAFYKINSARTKGCLIVFRQSVDNTPDYKKFGNNIDETIVNNETGIPPSFVLYMSKTHPLRSCERHYEPSAYAFFSD